MSFVRFSLKKSAAYVKIRKCKITPKLLGMPTISEGESSPLFETASLLVRPDHVANVIVNANHCAM